MLEFVLQPGSEWSHPWIGAAAGVLLLGAWWLLAKRARHAQDVAWRAELASLRGGWRLLAAQWGPPSERLFIVGALGLAALLLVLALWLPAMG